MAEVIYCGCRICIHWTDYECELKAISLNSQGLCVAFAELAIEDDQLKAIRGIKYEEIYKQKKVFRV